MRHLEHVGVQVDGLGPPASASKGLCRGFNVARQQETYAMSGD